MNPRDSAKHSHKPTSNRHADELGWEVVSPTSATTRQIELDDAGLTYTEKGSGVLVILVHGALGDYRTWSRHQTALAQQYHVVSYSRRYHQPDSSSGGVDYTYRRHACDLISLIDALKCGPAHIVGHSYGATVALFAAMERPEMVSGLTLGEPTVFSILSSLQDRVSIRLHHIALNVVQKLCENREQELAIREYLNIVTGKDSFDELPDEDQLVISQNALTLGPMLRTYFEPTELNPQRAESIKTPTLVIAGEFSQTIYRAIARELDKCLPNSELLILPGASHGLQMENPVAFDRAVIEFLSRQETALPTGAQLIKDHYASSTNVTVQDSEKRSARPKI